MRRDSENSSGPRIRFVWDASADAGDGASTPDVRRVPLRRVVLIGSGVLVVLLGAGFGVNALSSSQHHDAAGAAALTQPSIPAALGTSSPSPSASPTPRPSASPSASLAKSPSAAATSTSATAAAPTTSTAPAAVSVPPRIPAPAGNWLLNQTTGNTAVDSTGAHAGTAQNGWWAGGTFLSNGTNSQIYTNGPVLPTGSGQSFTVSAWVDMTALPAGGQAGETAVSQDGGVNSGFLLEYAGSAGRWAFTRVGSNGENPGVYRALSASAPSLGTWTHLVGVYDATNETQHLYVNGIPQGTATDPTPFAANGDLAISRGQLNGQETDWLKGAIKKVEVFSSALSAAQVSELS